MTFSDAWIEAGNDADFASFLEKHPSAGALPPPDSPYWITHLKDWAKHEGLSVEYPDYNVVRVLVSKTQLQRFIEQMLGPEIQTNDPNTLAGYVWQRCRDDRTYAIGADEF